MASQKYLKLSSGYQCPMLGLGTYLSRDPELLANALRVAIKTGYRHIDTAYLYGNEAVIGKTLKELFDQKVVTREEIFITTKLPPSHHRPEHVPEVLKRQLAALQLDYVDLYLIHNPLAMKHWDKPGFPMKADGTIDFDVETKLEDTYRALEECAKAGLIRSIGVSNFNESQLARILKICTIKPAMQQIESQPYFHNTKLIEFCHANNITVTAYGPFGSPGSGKIQNLLQDERLVKIGAKYGKGSGHVCLRWQLQRGLVVIPKSENPARIIDNFNVWDFELSAEDMAAIAAMDTNQRAFKADVFPGAKQHPEFPFTELL